MNDPTAIKLSSYHVVTDTVVDETDRRARRVVFATRTGAVRILDAATWTALSGGEFTSLSHELLLDLVDIELLVPSADQELQTILARNAAAAADSDTLYMVVQPTAHCQLGCGYCGQEHTSRRLSTKDQDLFIERVRRTLADARFDRLHICWFGAEPLSGLSVIRLMTPNLRAVAREADCAYQSHIVTNGLALTDKVATELVNEHGIIKIEVTLDGIGGFHDGRRHQKNGAPTFARIYRNVLGLAQRPDLDVRLTLGAPAVPVGR